MSKVIQSELVNPNQPYWNKAVECLDQGLSDVQAIQQVWQIMQPPALLSTLATIIGAVYADSYWATTRMDPNALASSLQAAEGFNFNDCLKAANFAFQKWYGLLVRANFQDSSFIPKSDPVTASPDVVVNGKATLTVQQLISKWNQYIYTPQIGLKNNTYGRAQSLNIQVPINQPRLRMFYTDAGFVPPPTSWIKLFTFDGSETSPMQGMQTGPIGVGERAANTNSFSFEPPGSGHYCLLALAVSEFFENNPLNSAGNWNSQEWIHFNGAAGWHNLDVTSANEASLKFYNQDGRTERFGFEAHCRNVPAGTEVSLDSSHDRLTAPISSGPVKIAGTYQTVATEADLPANFAGDLKVRFETPDSKPLPAGASIDVRSYWYLDRGHPHYAQAVEQLGAFRAAAVGESVRIPMGNFIFIGPTK